MPTYVYKCEKCENVFEENVKYEDRDAATEHPCQFCSGNVIRIPAMPLFAYDNIASKGHPKRPDKEFNDRLKDIRDSHRGSNVNIIE